MSWVAVGAQIGALERCCESGANEVEPVIIAGGQAIEDVLVGSSSLPAVSVKFCLPTKFRR